jgi:hypothetical protein
MSAMKQAHIEVVDLVCGCLQQNKTLSQTVNELKELQELKMSDNPYLSDQEFIEKTYYEYRGY